MGDGAAYGVVVGSKSRMAQPNHTILATPASPAIPSQVPHPGPYSRFPLLPYVTFTTRCTLPLSRSDRKQVASQSILNLKGASSCTFLPAAALFHSSCVASALSHGVASPATSTITTYNLHSNRHHVDIRSILLVLADVPNPHPNTYARNAGMVR
jgi:hypothetical protein